MNTISLNQTKEQVLGVLGSPQKESTESGMTVLWYNSQAPTLADFYYFQDGVLVLRSTSYYTKPLPFSDYLRQYGNPAQSIRKYNSQDSLMQTVHMWLSAGRAVTTIGSDRNSSVIREDTFAPISLQQYFATWGAGFAQNQHVAISDTLTQQVQSQPLPFVLVGVGAAGIVTVLVVCAVWLRKIIYKRSQRVV